ncbi:Serine/threonine protein kinase [Giardia duodenalis]|uniref:Serine/threonine protein kinase n=1 Tax=Giardia intestinalis TaxID=5741 RepID=V6U1L9_GIAIN|nr:Serine/threonine protein kinase [Giardia intestinalis]
MTTAFQQIAFIFANVDDSRLREEIERLRSKGELERAKGFLSQSVLEDDMLVVTELLELYCTLPLELKEMLISDENTWPSCRSLMEEPVPTQTALFTCHS